MTLLALAIFGLVALTLIGVFIVRRAKGVAGAMAFVFPSHPNRPPPELPEPETESEPEHDPDCVACAQLSKRGRYQPPEVLLEACFPVTCVSIVTGISEPDLARIAKSAGLVRVK